MIYPPPGADLKGRVETETKDPDRQLALMLVILAIGTAALFYAADLRLSSLIDTPFANGLRDQFGLGRPITTTTEVDILETPDTPEIDDVPTFPPPPAPTFDFGAYPTESAFPDPSYPAPSPLDPAMSATPAGDPIPESATPPLARSTATVDAGGLPGDDIATSTAPRISPPATATARTGYPDPGTK